MKTIQALIVCCAINFTLKAQVVFNLSSSPGVGNGPDCVASADVNGDGKVDLICANYYGNSLTVLTNNGSGGFVLSGTYAVGLNPTIVTEADVNGDGKVDLICVNSAGNSMTVLTNGGSGGFVLSGTYAGINGPTGVAAADVNGDGKVDLVTANWGPTGDGTTLSVFTNNGSGRFVLASSPVPGNGPYAVTAVDVNGDGKVDLINAKWVDSTVSVLTNNGSGGFASAGIYPVGNVPFSVAAADINGDGKVDLITANWDYGAGNTLTVLTNNGAGGFGFNSTPTVGTGPTVVAVADVNGDGRVDLISANSGASIMTVLTNNGSGGFLLATNLNVGISANWVSAADVNGDGKMDLIGANGGNMTLSVLTNATPWILPLYNLQTAVSGGGNIMANPVSGPYTSNSVVILAAIPSAYWSFDHWTGDASGSQNPLTVTMNGPHSVQAVFLQIPFYSLNTSVIGSGTITTNPTSSSYPSNSVVAVTAYASPGWLFDHWTGDASGNQNPLNLALSGPRNVQAVFVQVYPLTVSTPGGGSVTVDGQVIAPGTFYPAGSVVTLAATASPFWSFLGWQGNAGGTNNPLSVTMNETNNIQAIFGTIVSTNTLGGGGVVLNQPNPIPFGTVLTASAVPNAGNYFVAWDGVASGTNTPTTVTVMSPAPTIRALFTALPDEKYSLGVVVMGNGSVAISPQQNYYNPGDTVILSENPSPGATIFYGWTGDASGTNNPIAVVMNSNKIVQASFGAQPIVSIAPLNLIIGAGSNGLLNASAAGLPPLTYQWWNSHGTIAGQTNATYTILNAQATNSDNYVVVVSNSFGSVTSAVATVTVVFPPSNISLQPTNQIVAAGASLALGVSASGTAPLSYQWLNSAGAIPGQTNTSLILDPALTNYTDNYSVLVSNSYGMVTSQVATAFVYLPVSILAQPYSLAVPYQAPASFSVVASGFPAPTSYQWTFNGTNLPEATSSSLTINHVGLADTGLYQVFVGNGYSSTNCDIVTLNMSPSITSPFGGATAVWGSSAAISVGAIGSGNLNYQWYLNGAPIDGATSATLNFSSIQFTNGGLYSVVVSSSFGSVTNVEAQVIVNPAGVAIGFYPGVTISGAVGYSYRIQSSSDLADTNSWVTQTNLTLTLPVQIWVDTTVDVTQPFNPLHFYRVLPGQ